MFPGTAADLLLLSIGADSSTSGRDQKVLVLARVVTATSLPGQPGAKGPEDWVTRFLEAVEDTDAPQLARPTRRALADGAWKALQAHLPGLTPGPVLELVLKELGLSAAVAAKAEKAPERHDTVDESRGAGSLSDPGRTTRKGQPFWGRRPKGAHEGIAHPGDDPPPAGHRRGWARIAAASDNAKRVMLAFAVVVCVTAVVSLAYFVFSRAFSPSDHRANPPAAVTSSGAPPSAEAQASSAPSPTATSAIPVTATFVISVDELKESDANIRDLFERKADELARGRSIVTVLLTPIDNEGQQKLATAHSALVDAVQSQRFKAASLKSLSVPVVADRGNTFPGAAPGVGVTLIFAPDPRVVAPETGVGQRS
jgi:hypothetical protein